MKKLMYIFGILALLLVGTACGSEEETTKGDESQNPPPEKPIEGPEIPFTEYFLIESIYEEVRVGWTGWKNLDDVSWDERKLVVIDSDDELRQYIVDENYPPVDFSKKTLILAYGIELGQNYPNAKKIQRVSEQDYVVTINLQPNIALLTLHWQVAILVDKLSDQSTVELNITRETGLLPGDPQEDLGEGTNLPYTVFSSEMGTSWRGISSVWALPYYLNVTGNLILVNSYEEMQPYYRGTDDPAIDFSQQSLLLASGITRYHLVETTIPGFQQFSRNRYRLTVNTDQTYGLALGCWNAAILVDKLSDEDDIRLIVKSNL